MNHLLGIFTVVVTISSCITTTFSHLPPTPLSLTGAYTTTFDAMTGSAEGEVYRWEQGETVPHWWSSESVYKYSDGAINDPGLYSLGEAGSDERSIGGLLSHHKKEIVWGISMVNAFPHDVTHAVVKIIGEQWRYGGTPDSETHIEVDYSITTRLRYDKKGGWGVNGVHTQDWDFIPELNVTSIVDSGDSPKALPGDLNQQALGVNLTFQPPWKRGHVLQLRFVLRKRNFGASNCLAIRSVTFDPRRERKPFIAATIGWVFVSLGLLTLVAGVCIFIYKKRSGIPAGYVPFATSTPSSPALYRSSESNFFDSGDSDSERFGTFVPPIANLYDMVRSGDDLEAYEGADERMEIPEESPSETDALVHHHSEPLTHHYHSNTHTTCVLCGKE